ncbi:alpha-1,4-N-acetylglucosaminyltransferase-like [Hyperolius riggenbachi]|uniref:alpha-1,4-N-acetylglucosaminyltransferase-like n=1 Tax=Hyperolius riggenbachi TaxID=752182 RepID=UPI0035A263AF
MQPPSLVLCAIESAARVYEDRPVVFFMKGLNDSSSEANKKKYFPSLSSFKNVYVFPLRMEEIFADTPLSTWYQKIDPKKELYWTHVSADGCRLALIWKHGGIYMDTDIISIKRIPHQHFLAAETHQYSSNGIFGLSSHHAFTWKGMEDFAQNYQGDEWGYQGPDLFTRTLQQFCTIPQFIEEEDIVCGNIMFLHPFRFYPIPYQIWKRYYEVWDEEPTFDYSYALHLWNYMNEEGKTMVLGSNTLVEHLYQKYCPSVYGELAGNKNTV